MNEEEQTEFDTKEQKMLQELHEQQKDETKQEENTLSHLRVVK